MSTAPSLQSQHVFQGPHAKQMRKYGAASIAKTSYGGVSEGSPAGGPGSLQVRNIGSRCSGSSVFRFLALHSHAGSKVPIHITLGCNRGSLGIGREYKNRSTNVLFGELGLGRAGVVSKIPWDASQGPSGILFGVIC